MTTEGTIDNKKKIYKNIEVTLSKHCCFLAYFTANVLLHDADKMSDNFLRWSLGERNNQDYLGHDISNEERCEFLHNTEKMKEVFPDTDSWKIAFPIESIALEESRLKSELLTDWLSKKHGDELFINELKKTGFAQLANKFSKKFDPRSFFSENSWPKYLKILKEPFFACLKTTINKQLNDYRLFSAKEGKSFYDCYNWHHDPSIVLKTNSIVPTILQLFSAGTAGIDGQDTGYETEGIGLSSNTQHHNPDTLKDKNILIATPFGNERLVALDCAMECARTLDIAGKIKALAGSINNNNDPFTKLAELEEVIRQVFELTTIRTGRPINDVTLADHSLSTGALARAHGARVVLETICNKFVENNTENKDCPKTSFANSEEKYYAMPMRGKHVETTENKDWPKTSFALFSCAVNADYLDDMAMDLPDITAIRNEVGKLFDCFSETFCQRFPVGGSVYRDQYGVHIVVPELGDVNRRWRVKVKGGKQSNGGAEAGCHADGEFELKWKEDSTDMLSNKDFVEWLFEKANNSLRSSNVQFGRELNIGLRYAPIDDKLNKLAEAIEWSRRLGGRGQGEPQIKEPQRTQYFFIDNDSNETRGELCKVCRLRFAEKVDPKAEAKAFRRNKGKCGLCIDRVNNHIKDRDVNQQRENPETDLEDMAKHTPDDRLVLVSVSFNLNDWLGEESNSGIFCYGNAAGDFPKEDSNKRLNSFGRLRRIWRSSEDFLLRMKDEAQKLCSLKNEARDIVMRTIMLQPQDLQIILPAHKAGELLDIINAN